MSPAVRGALLGALALAASVALGCGGGDSTRSAASANHAAAGGNGRLTYAIPPLSGGMDPLTAASLSAQIVTRQIFEPLIASLDAPYGGRSGVAGLVLSIHPSGDSRVWRLDLRPGARFQDGRLLDASVVLANVRRWRDSPVGRALLPGLIAADGPRPSRVRFVFSSPVPDLPRRLADPRLGLVSPGALDLQTSAREPLRRVTQAGSGPFELIERGTNEIVLKRNGGWWGTREGLGPALDGIAFRPASRLGRLKLLHRGAVQVAADVGRNPALRLRGEPLLTSVAIAGPHAVGLARSVRGISGWRRVSLSGVWLALLG